jgi:poly-gamma-glutamate synthesis protein (capsule biosynthesis protein)
VRDLSRATVRRVGALVSAERRRGDVVVASIHWGGNWGYEVPAEHRRFAHGLIEEAGVDVVHGHSSHHALGIEVHHGRLVLHGCGDLVNDYEGISGHRGYRPELRLMYFPTLDAETGRLVALRLVPLRARRFTLVRASRDDAVWLIERLGREGAALRTKLSLEPDGALVLAWC